MGTTLIDNSGNPIIFARSNYTASAGGPEPWASVPPMPDYDVYADGPFYRNSKITISSITDGLSNTVFLGEGSPVLSDKTWVGVVPGAISCPKPQFAFASCDVAATMVQTHSGPDPLAHRESAHNPPAQLPLLQGLPDVLQPPQRLQRSHGRRQRPVCNHVHQYVYMARSGHAGGW